jgi:MFS family permease
MFFSTISYAVASFQRAVTSVLFGELSGMLGVSNGWVTICSGMFFLGSAIAAISVGSAVRCVSPVLLQGVFVLLESAAGLILCFANSFIYGCIARFFVGVGCGPSLLLHLFIAMRSSITPRTFFRGQAAAIIAGCIGTVFCQIILSVVLDFDVWWPSLLIVTTGVGASAGVMLSVLHKRLQMTTVELAQAQVHQLANPLLELDEESKAKPGKITCCTFVALILQFACAPAVFFNVVSLWAGPYLTHYMTFITRDSGIVQASLSLGGLIGLFSAGVVVNRVKITKVLRKIILLALSTVVLAVIAALTWMPRTISGGVALVLFVFIGFATLAGVPIVATAFKPEKEESKHIVIGTGVMNLVVCVAQGIAAFEFSSFDSDASELTHMQLILGFASPSALAILIGLIGVLLA